MKRQLITLSLFFTGLCFVVAQVPLKWQRVYGEGLYNTCQGALQTETGHYILLQNQSSITGNTQLLLTCLDSLGVISWEKRIGDSALYWGSDLKQCADKGFIITGHTYTNTEKSYDLLLIKTDSAGNIQWERQMGGSNWDFGQSVIITPDSAYLALGKTYSYGAGEADVYVLKLNFQGDTIWTRTFGGDSLDYGTSMDITADSCYLIAANTKSFGHGDLDAWIMKLSVEGDTIWSKLYGDTLEDAVNCIKVLPDKGFIFVGYTYSFGAQNSDAYLMRTDSNYADMWWLPVFWMPSAGYDVLTHVSYNDSLQFVLSGWTTSGGSGGEDAVLTIMGDDWDFKYSGTFGTPEDEESSTSWQTSDQGYMLVSTSFGTGPANSNVYVVKTGQDCTTAGTVINTIGFKEYTAEDTPSSFSLFPNPAGESVTLVWDEDATDKAVTVSIFNIQGQCISQLKTVPSSVGALTFDISNITAGLYLVKVMNGSTMAAFRLIKE